VLILPNDPFHLVKLMLAQGRLKDVLYASDLLACEFSPVPGGPTPKRRHDRDKEGTDGETEQYRGKGSGKRRAHTKWSIAAENKDKGQENRRAQAPHGRKEDQ
jgi:hypothetical protein